MHGTRCIDDLLSRARDKAYTTPKYPKIGSFEKVEAAWLMIPNPGKMRMKTSGWPIGPEKMLEQYARNDKGVNK